MIRLMTSTSQRVHCHTHLLAHHIEFTATHIYNIYQHLSTVASNPPKLPSKSNPNQKKCRTSKGHPNKLNSCTFIYSFVF